MPYKGPESFEPAPTATIIHAYNSEGVSLVVLTDEEIWDIIKASGASLIGKPSMQPRVMVLDRFIEERGVMISQVEESLAIEESHASYFWEKQVIGKSSFEMACMEVNTCGDSLSPKALSTFLDCCDYPELVSFIYHAPTPLLKDFKISSKDAMLKQCFTYPTDCYSRYHIECYAPIDIPTGKMFIARMVRKDQARLVERFREGVFNRYARHAMRLTHGDRKLKLMVNSQQEEYLSCAFYDCDANFLRLLCNPKKREDEAFYVMEDCFDDVLLTTDTSFVYDHDFDPPGYTGVWVTGGTGYIAIHVTPHHVGRASNFVELCGYIHPSMWVFDRESLVHVVRPLLRLFRPDRAELHFRIASGDLTHGKVSHVKFIRKHLIGAGYLEENMTTFRDDYFGRTFFHIDIVKKGRRKRQLSFDLAT
jgi:S-adenosylmethionine/arginine decarboxylase-like enzyme